MDHDWKLAFINAEQAWRSDQQIYVHDIPGVTENGLYICSLCGYYAYTWPGLAEPSKLRKVPDCAEFLILQVHDL